MRLVRFPLAAAMRAASRLGVEPTDFRFQGMTAVSPRMNRHWLTTAAYLARSFTGPDTAVAHPLMYASLVDAVATAAVAVFPNTTMTIDYAAGPGRVPPVAVRRAVAYIDAHAAEPITLDDIAAAAGVGIRGLQAAFARHRDTGPMGYLKRVRLARAHRDLQAGDPARGDTVTAIARRWGFAGAGRFAADYRKAFGQPPSRTLGA
jgi:AraC-like DNA-binding protein